MGLNAGLPGKGQGRGPSHPKISEQERPQGDWPKIKCGFADPGGCTESSCERLSARDTGTYSALGRPCTSELVGGAHHTKGHAGMDTGHFQGQATASLPLLWKTFRSRQEVQCRKVSTILPYCRTPSISQDSRPEERKTPKPTLVPQLSWAPPPLSAMFRVSVQWGNRVKEYAGELQSSKQSSTHMVQLKTLLVLTPKCGEPSSTESPLQAEKRSQRQQEGPRLLGILGPQAH